MVPSDGGEAMDANWRKCEKKLLLSGWLNTSTGYPERLQSPEVLKTEYVPEQPVVADPALGSVLN